MKKLLSALFLLALCASIAAANVPDPSKCTVTPADALNGVILAPDSPSPIPQTVYTVTVRNADNNPINNAQVTFDFPSAIRKCTTAVHSGTTNTSGVVTITLRGGGCQNNVSGACVVKANGITIRSYLNAKSPDYDGSQASGSVILSDLVNFKTGNLCHDYNNAGGVDLGDLIIFAAAFSPSHTCTLQ